MKVGEIRDCCLVLSQIANKRLPVKLAYAVGRNLTKLSPEYETAETQRTKLCEEYAERGDDGKPVMVSGNYQIAADRAEEFQAQINDLFDMDVEVELMKVDTAVLDALDADRYDPLTPAQIMAIGWMIEDKTC